jgi:hypothetical protein
MTNDQNHTGVQPNRYRNAQKMFLPSITNADGQFVWDFEFGSLGFV